MALSDREELELLELEAREKKSRPTPLVLSGDKKTPEWSDPDVIAASTPIKFAKGAASPLVGLFQLGANMVPGRGKDAINKYIADYEKMGQEGAKKIDPDGYGDAAEFAGTMLSPGFLKGGQVAAKAETLGQKTIQGATAGTVAGATAPVTQDDGNFWEHKGVQTALGMGVGGLLPSGISAVKAIGNALGRASDLIMPGGGKRIADRHMERIVGQEDAPAVIDALEKSHNLVPHSEPTAAQALHATPGGSPVMAQQKITAATPGGISADFFERQATQEQARADSMRSLVTGTDPMRLAVANALLRKLQASPPHLGNTPPPNSVPRETPQEFIKALKKDDSFVKEVTGIRMNIEDVFNKAQLKKLNRIAEDISQQASAAKPIQKTNLQGGVNVAEETRTKLPQLLSRPMMITNAILHAGGKGVEPKVDAALADMFLNPQKLAEALRTVPPGPNRQVIEALLQNVGSPAAIAAQQEGK